MDYVRLVLLLLHILGFAALLGGLLAQAKDSTKRITSTIRDGAGTAFVAGLLLVGVLEAIDGVTLDHMKVGVKLAIGLVILILVMMNLKKERISQGLWLGLVVATVVNIVVALFWASAHKAPEVLAALPLG